MNDDPLDNMRARVEQFRKLADLTHDHEMRLSLRGWADDVEKDLRRLEDERLERRAG